MSTADGGNQRLDLHIVKSYGDETARTFAPPPLPPDPPVRLDAIQGLLEQANQSLGGSTA